MPGAPTGLPANGFPFAAGNNGTTLYFYNFTTAAWNEAGSSSGGVTSVNGQTGAVVIASDVTSVNGQNGSVTLNLNDLGDVNTSGGATGNTLTQQADGTFAPQAPSGGSSQFKGFSVLSDGGSVGANQGAFIEYDTIEFDTENAFNLTTNQYTIPTTGYWQMNACLLYTSPSPRDKRQSRMPSSA